MYRDTWDITVSQPIVILYSYTFVLWSEGPHIKFFNPDQVQIHTGFFTFLWKSVRFVTIKIFLMACTQSVKRWMMVWSAGQKGQFLDWASRMVNSKLSLSIKEIMFGIINNDSKFCLALNHLVIIGKYFLYVKALNGKFYIFNEFVSLARDKISLEKYISCTTGREKDFRTKWSVFSSLLNTVWNSVYLTDCTPI